MPTAKAALMALLGPGIEREEQTTTGNVGAYPVPIGQGVPLKQVFPSTAGPKRKRKRKRKPVGLSAFGAPMEDAELLARARHQLARLQS
jgi:hypothetical protein